MVHSKNRLQGFTLVELMLAMAFLSAILLFATLTFVQALAVYNKGISVTQINETGRAITTDLGRATNGASSFAVSALDKPQFICVGKTAYMWNLSETTGSNVYTVDNVPISMVRTKDGVDARTRYCSDGGTHAIARDDVTSMIGSQVHVLDVNVVKPNPSAADDSLEAPLIKFTLTIGTRSSDGIGNPSMEPGNMYWSCPAGSFGTFCAVGTYSTTIYIPSGS